MNMLIAKAHRFGSQLSGLQMTIANIVAIVLSAFSVVAGLVCLSIIALPGKIVYYVVFGVAGLLLAWLVESLTVSNLRKLRVSNKGLDSLEIAEVQRGDQLNEQGRKLLERQKKQLKAARNVAIGFAGFGIIVSATGGGLFWHVALEALPVTLNIVISTLFAVVVSATFVCTEMYKEVNKAAVAESISAGDLIKMAHREEASQEALERLRKEQQQQLSEEKAVKSIEDGARRHMTAVVREVITEDDEYDPEAEILQVIESTFNNQAALPAPRRDKKRNMALIQGLLDSKGEDYVRAHVEEIASDYGISRSTVYNYLKELCA